MNVGIVGCGKISDVYIRNCARFPGLKVVACADIDPARAQAKAGTYGIPRCCSTEELLLDPGVDVVLNLTVPLAHFEIARQALEAGKHVYNEKPLAVTREHGAGLLKIAAERKRRIGCAPDTFMGAALQACRKVIDTGAIGQPVAATAFMMCHGHESWHPDPDFYYQAGGGPLYDMGPYYLAALVHLLGPVRRVSAFTRKFSSARVIGSGPRKGTKVPVETDTHLSGTLEFADGAICTMIMSFDAWAHHLPPMEIHGTEGSLSVPDPNNFGGTVGVMTPRSGKWEEVPVTFGYTENSRGLGLADMALAIEARRPHRASAELAFHVLDVMEAFYDSSRTGRHAEVVSRCERPVPMREELRFGEI